MLHTHTDTRLKELNIWDIAKVTVMYIFTAMLRHSPFAMRLIGLDVKAPGSHPP